MPALGLFAAVALLLIGPGSVGAAAPEVALHSTSYIGNWTNLHDFHNPGNLSEFGFVWIPNGSAGYGLLFGGRTGPTGLSDATWTFARGHWHLLNLSVHPSARRGLMLTYDAADGYAVLFGGSNRTAYLNDTWTFAAGHWTPLVVSTAPPARRVGVLAYDNATRSTILFGGHNGGIGARYLELSDTWKFTGGRWTLLHPKASPPARSEASMTYDAAAKILVLFGGYAQPASSYLGLNDTWYWQAGNWYPAAPTLSPPERDGSSMAYDPAVRGVVLVGGHFDSNNASAKEYRDTWLLTGSTGAKLNWTKVVAWRGPAGLDAANLLYDPAAHGLILYGGRTGAPTVHWFHATWELAVA